MRLDRQHLPLELAQFSARLRTLLRDRGFYVLESDALDAIVPGQYCELDDAPATVFQVLFSEIG